MTLEKYVVQNIESFPPDGLTGRRKIKTVAAEITEENARDVLEETLSLHALNAAEIQYLYDYYRGKQDIRDKQKYVRENINNKVVVNRANEVVTFKTSYLLNEPIQYISTGGKNSISAQVSQLNAFMRSEDKESKDKEIVDWMHICGVSERFVLTDEMAGSEDGAPFLIYTLDPRFAYVVYSAKIGEKPLCGVILQYDENNKRYADMYTDRYVFTVTDESVTVREHYLGDVPLIEYINNEARMGAFEVVISLLNNINTLESNAVDAVQYFVNGFDVFQNADIDDGSYSELSIGGKAVKIKTVVPGMEARVYRVASELNQNYVQQRVDDLTEAYLTICGMPNRNGGSSTSDTGQAVIFRDGFFEAESRAKDTEKLYIRSERKFLKIVLNICSAKNALNLDIRDVGINFARKSLNNLQSRFQCLSEGLSNDKIHPEMVYNAFGDIFGDKAMAYQKGMEWYEERKAENEEKLNAELDREREMIENDGTVSTGGQGNSSTEPENSTGV